MPAENAPEFSVFWSLLIPAVMAGGSIIITYLLYRHFAAKVDERHGGPGE